MADILSVASVFVFILGSGSRVLSSIDCHSYCTDEVGQPFSCVLTLIDMFDTGFRLHNKCGPSKPTSERCITYKDGDDSILQANWMAPDDSSIYDLTGFKVDVEIPNKLRDYYIINSTINISQATRFKYRIECRYADIRYKIPVFMTISSVPRNGVVSRCSNQSIRCSWEVTNGNFDQNILSPTFLTTSIATASPTFSTTSTFPTTSTATATALLAKSVDSKSHLAITVVPVVVIISVGLAVLVYLIRKKVMSHQQNLSEDNTDTRRQHTYDQYRQNGHVHNCPVHGPQSNQFSFNHIQDRHLQRNRDNTAPKPSSTEMSYFRPQVGSFHGATNCRTHSFSSNDSQDDNQCLSIESRMLDINDMLGTV